VLPDILYCPTNYYVFRLFLLSHSSDKLKAVYLSSPIYPALTTMFHFCNICPSNFTKKRFRKLANHGNYIKEQPLEHTKESECASTQIVLLFLYSSAIYYIIAEDPE
jgi:hypothetical protein